MVTRSCRRLRDGQFAVRRQGPVHRSSSAFRAFSPRPPGDSSLESRVIDRWLRDLGLRNGQCESSPRSFEAGSYLPPSLRRVLVQADDLAGRTGLGHRASGQGVPTLTPGPGSVMRIRGRRYACWGSPNMKYKSLTAAYFNSEPEIEGAGSAPAQVNESTKVGPNR